MQMMQKMNCREKRLYQVNVFLSFFAKIDAITLQNMFNISFEEFDTESQLVNKEDECIEIHPTQEQQECDYFAPDLVITLNCMPFQNNHRVYHVPIEDVIDKLIDQTDDIGCAEQNHSDLIAGIYEGMNISLNRFSFCLMETFAF